MRSGSSAGSTSSPSQRWVDVGCGTGALTQAILERGNPTSVVGVDSSQSFVAWADEHIADSRARFDVGDATQLAPGTADVVVSGIVLTFLPQPVVAVSAMRAAAPAGLVAAYVWDYAGGMELMRYFWDAAAISTRAPQTSMRDDAQGRRDAGPSRGAVAGGRPIDISSTAIEIPTVFRDFDDYWTPFLGGQGPAPTYTVSLDEERRAAVREGLRARLPIEEQTAPFTSLPAPGQ